MTALRYLLFSAACLLVVTPAMAKPKGHRVLAADGSRQTIAIVEPDGSISWKHKVGPIHDLHLLPNGNVLFQLSWTRIVEMDPKTDKIVWEYDSAKQNGNQGKKVEVHAFQRLKDGTTMIAESGPGRIIEVDKDGKIQHQFKMKVGQPSPHRDTRLARKLDNGHYLIAHEGDGAVREYDAEGKVVWEFDVPLFDRKPAGGHGPESWGNSCFAAIRLENGNTLIATGNGHSVLEVSPEKKIVWKLEQKELPGISLAWVTTLQQLANGNLIIGNCHAGPDNPQIVEITRDKKVVWTFKDFKNFGNSLANSEVLDQAGAIR